MTSLDETTSAIIEVALRTHRRFGGSLLESACELLVFHGLKARGFQVDRQLAVTFSFEGIELANAFRVDLLVNNQVVVEIKSVERLRPAHEKQLLTYLRIMNLPVGLLLNFGQETLKDGLRRVVNNLEPGDSPALYVNQSPGEVVR